MEKRLKWSLVNEDLTNPVPLKDGRVLLRAFTGRFSYTDGGHTVELDIAVDAGGVPNCVEVRVTRGDHPLRLRDDVADEPLGYFFDYAVAQAAYNVNERDDGTRWYSQAITSYPAPVPVRRRRRDSVTPELLREVAEVYKSGKSKPTRTVREHFNKSQRTASRWVALARDAGYITDAPAD